MGMKEGWFSGDHSATLPKSGQPLEPIPNHNSNSSREIRAACAEHPYSLRELSMNGIFDQLPLGH
jgi:hypothetical protein